MKQRLPPFEFSLGDDAGPRVVDPIAVDAAAAAQRLDLSRSAFLSGVAGGLIPEGVRIGGCRRWSVADLDAWLAAGCPSAARWKMMKAGGGRKAGAA